MRRAAVVVAVCLSACARGGDTAGDSAFAELQKRGQGVMGVDQYASKHVFEDLADGGRVVLDVDNGADTAGVRTVRAHMRDIEAAFRAGDFSKPFAVHAQEVAGTKVMAVRKAMIEYRAVDRPKGGEVRITTKDSAAIAAVHAFLAFQRTDHRAAGHERSH